MEKSKEQEEFLSRYSGFPNSDILRALTLLRCNAMIHNYQICYGGLKILQLFELISSTVFGTLGTVVMVLPFFKEHTAYISEKSSSNIKYATFKDFQKSREDLTTIFLGVGVEPAMEYLNFLIEGLVNNYLIVFHIAIVCFLNIFVKLCPELVQLAQFFVGIPCLLLLAMFLKSAVDCYLYRHSFYDCIYHVMAVVLDVLLFMFTHSLRLDFLTGLSLRIFRDWVYLTIIIFAWAVLLIIILLGAALDDYQYVRKNCIMIDLKHIWNSDSYKMKITINGILFDAKIGFFYLDFREDAVYFKRAGEPSVRLDYSLIDRLEILGDDIYDSKCKKRWLIMKPLGNQMK